jgi:hypothetical protein
MDDRTEPQTSDEAQGGAAREEPPAPPPPPRNDGVITAAWVPTTPSDPLSRPSRVLPIESSNWVPSPPRPTASFWVPNSEAWDVPAEIARSRQISPALLATLGATEPPFPPADTVAAPFGEPTSTDPIALYHEMRSRTAVLEKMMAELQGQWPGIGHNNPPEPIGDDDRRAIDQAVAVLKAQPLTPASPTDARNAATTLKAIGERLWMELVRAGGYTAKQADTFISEAMKSAGTETGKWVVRLALAGTLMALAHSVTDWLGSLFH